MIYTYIRHYDILSLTLYFFYYCSLYFFLPQNPDIIIIIIMRRVTRKIFEIDLFVSVLVCYINTYITFFCFITFITSAGHLYDDDVTQSLHPNDQNTQVCTLLKTKSSNFMYYIISKTYTRCVGGSFDRVFYLIYSFDKFKLLLNIILII